MKLRPFIFWPHLIAGVCAGVVILVMSVTGVLLTYERQLIAWSDSGFRSQRPDGAATPLRVDALLAAFQKTHPGVTPTTVTVRAEDDAPVAIAASQSTFYVDRYAGVVLGEASRTVRDFMTALRSWHRWLGAEAGARPVARAITGWANAIFLFIVVSGIYLWFPRAWTARQLRAVMLFNPRARGKARDFNWHNVIGSWCAIPLFVIVLCAMPISFAWFNALVYRAVGETPPPQGARNGPRQDRAGRGQAAEGSESRQPAELNPLWTRAEAQVIGWRTLSLRIPAPSAPQVVFNIDRGDGGQPHLRSTLTLDMRTGNVVRHEMFSDLTPGRRIRSAMRFAHTGELLGVTGQTIAGIVSAGGAVLVWTGLALAWRRFRSWRGRNARASERSPISNAA